MDDIERLLARHRQEKRQKTADQMFRDLGYKKVPSPYHQIIYRKEDEKTEIICFCAGLFFEIFYEGCLICFSSAEIKACNKLIEELEANNEADQDGTV